MSRKNTRRPSVESEAASKDADDVATNSRSAGALAALLTGLPAGPLTTDKAPPETDLLRSRPHAAVWVAFVGLGGRYCHAGDHGWFHWVGTSWRPVDPEHVVTAMRYVLQSAYDRLRTAPEAHDPELVLRLLDLNWSLPLVHPVRALVQVSPKARP